MTATSLPPLVDTAPTRETLHRLAEQVLAAEQHAANGELALGVTPGGFATGWFPSAADGTMRIRVEGHRLIRESETHADLEPIGEPFDPPAAAVLYEWWAFGDAVLRQLVARPGESISPIVLWPEHFDIAITLTTAAGLGMNLGFSPGDEFCEQPYVYAGPWEAQSGPFWNAPFGAYRTYQQIAASDGSRAAAAEFLEQARAMLADAPAPVKAPADQSTP
jgi:hypothetical protein